ncbi:MAG: tyrosine-type recombinase/integrase [Bdellovibrionales bacterium]
MAISSYIENGKEFWEVYVHVRSEKSRKIRSQKRILGVETKEEADKLYKREFQQACIRVARRENEGATWQEVVDSWELYHRKYPSKKYDPSTIRDYASRMHRWTKSWAKRPAAKLTPADGHEVIELAKPEAGKTLLHQIKSTINVIYKWGIGHGHIPGKETSPVADVELEARSEDSLPEILNRGQVVTFLERAREREHPWYAVWKFDAYCGLRAGEVEGLRVEDLELVSSQRAMELDRFPSEVKKNYGMIRVQRAWKNKLKAYGSTKGRYWRNVPISSQLYWFLVKEHLPSVDFGSDEHGRRLFPEFAELRRGEQAKVLRAFCEAEKLPSIKFHTIRACFATMLISSGIPATTVMKIGGWKNYKTMMIYVRLAGIDEAGATEGIDLNPTDNADAYELPENVVPLFKAKL